MKENKFIVNKNKRLGELEKEREILRNMKKDTTNKIPETPAVTNEINRLNNSGKQSTFMRSTNKNGKFGGKIK